MGATPHGVTAPPHPPETCHRCPAPPSDVLISYHCPECGSEVHAHVDQDLIPGPTVLVIGCTGCGRPRQVLILIEDRHMAIDVEVTEDPDL